MHIDNMLYIPIHKHIYLYIGTISNWLHIRANAEYET